MKIVKKDLRNGLVTIKLESPDDVWYVSQLIDPGDTIKGKTPRKVKATEEATGERRMIFLAIEVEKTEFTEDAVRAGGKIVDGPDDVPRGSYHTFSIEEGSIITIQKPKWYGFQLDRIREASESKVPKILICIFDREEAYFALMKRSGVDIVAHVRGEVARKRMSEKTKGSFYEQILKQLEEYDARYKLDFIILASPSFWKEELLKVLKNEELKKKIIQATCSSVDEGAFNEVLRRDEVRAALQQERTSKEMVLVETVMAEIAKKGKVAYGLKQVGEAAEAGAVEQLLVTDALIQKLRQEGTFGKLDAVMKQVDKSKGHIMLISTAHAGGKKLDGIGGVAALLRYKLSYE